MDQASEVLARLGRVPVADSLDADYREALATLALLEAEHGPASLVAPTVRPTSARRAGLGATWARADVDHLVQAALACEAGPELRSGCGGALEDLIEQIAAHRDADPRIGATLGLPPRNGSLPPVGRRRSR